MSTPILLIAEEADAGARLDAFVARGASISRAVAARLIAAGSVLVDGSVALKSLRIEPGARVEVDLPDDVAAPAGEEIAVPIAFEDRWLVVVAKPAGLVVHPAPGHVGGTLVNALLARSDDDRPVGGDDEDRPGIVHRLDATTSGLMVVAKDVEAHARLVEMIAAREVVREYLGLVEDAPDTDTATIDAPIGRSPKHRKKMAVVAGGREALTRIEVVERHARTSLVRAKLETGRTHQIRVHLAAVGHPIAGDRVYGKSRALARELGLDRPFLHAERLAFAHPITGEPIDLQEPLPPDLTEALARARTLT